jgi:outer membrane receptor protein involved in Fe transport
LPGQEPAPVDWLGSALEISYRPIRPLDIDTTFLYNRFDNEHSGAQVLEDFIGRVRVNWQFSRELSLRTIAQYERTRPNESETSVTNRRNWNVDLLLTWRLNPWTAAYLGYNQNRRNVAIDEVTGTPRIVRTDELFKDSEQLILKLSYVFRR